MCGEDPRRSERSFAGWAGKRCNTQLRPFTLPAAGQEWPRRKRTAQLRRQGTRQFTRLAAGLVLNDDAVGIRSVEMLGICHQNCGIAEGHDGVTRAV